MMKEIIWHLSLMLEKNDTSIINNEFSHHMIGDKTKFEHFERYDGGSVRFGNNEPCCIKVKYHSSLINEFICDNAYWIE